MSTKYALLSLPLGVFESSDRDDAVSALSATVSPDNGSVGPFAIPDFKIGTLDALVQQADDLSKLEASCQAVVAKVGDSLRQLLNNDEERLASYKMVNNSPSLPSHCRRGRRADHVFLVQNRPTSTSAVSAGTRSGTEPTSLWESS